MATMNHPLHKIMFPLPSAHWHRLDSTDCMSVICALIRSYETLSVKFGWIISTHIDTFEGLLTTYLLHFFTKKMVVLSLCNPI